MAKRRTITIDGENYPIDSGSTIRTALQEAGVENPPSVVSGGEVITPSDYDRPAPPHGMITNPTPIEKGATLRDRLLDQEFKLIAHFLGEFPGRPRSMEIDEATLVIRAFPLPDDYTPDHIDLLIVTLGYPTLPPAGIYIPAISPNRKQIAEHLGGHLMSGTPSHLLNHTPSSYHEQLKEVAGDGWDWCCFHYKDWEWRKPPVNPNRLLSTDGLYKFVENVFAALSGGHRG